MPIFSVGRTREPFLVSRFWFLVRGQLETRNEQLETESGVTLIEMLVVVALISVMIGVSFPAITSGVDSLRLKGATTSIVNFLNAGLDRAQRRQQTVEITISQAANTLEMRSTEREFFRQLELPDGVTITRVLPVLEDDNGAPRTFLLYPGSTAPRFGVQLMNRRNIQRIVSVDPITGVPRVEQPEQ